MATKRNVKKSSKQLAMENKSMEDKLNALRHQMESERAKIERNRVTPGGSRWSAAARYKSSSLRGYAQEVKQGKYRKRNVVDRTNVADWTIENVLEWLTELGLRKYHGCFSENEVNGEVLLEIEADDMDFLNIKILAHRKKILNEVEAMRQIAGLPPTSAINLSSGFQSPQQQQRLLSVSNGIRSVEAEKESKDQHQDQSLLSGELDEKAEQEAFKRAVEEWRNGAASKSESKAANQRTVTLSSSTATSNTSVSEAQEHEEFQMAVLQWRSMAQSKPENEGSDLEIQTFDDFKQSQSSEMVKRRTKLLQSYEQKLMEPCDETKEELLDAIQKLSKEQKCEESKKKKPIVNYDFAY